MKIPLTKYELGHVRKAATAGVLALIGAAPGILGAHLPIQAEVASLVGAFLLPALAVFGVKNKDLEQAVQVIDEIDPSIAGVVNQVLAQGENAQPAPVAVDPSPEPPVVVDPVAASTPADVPPSSV